MLDRDIRNSDYLSLFKLLLPLKIGKPAPNSAFETNNR